MIKKLHYGILIILLSVTCDDFGSNNNSGPLETVYVALQGLDQVAIVNVNSSEIDFVDVEYATMNHQGHMMEMGNHTPHFIEIDEINRLMVDILGIFGFIFLFFVLIDLINISISLSFIV